MCIKEATSKILCCATWCGRFAIYGKETRRVMLYLANVKTSDEMLLPTLLQVSAALLGILCYTILCHTMLYRVVWSGEL